METSIGEIIRVNYGGRNPFVSISRPYRQQYNIDRELEVIEAIGKSRNNRFVIDSDNEFVYRNFLMWLWNDPRMVCHTPRGEQTKGRLTAGIYISGNTGSGKSWVMEIMGVYARIIKQPILTRYKSSLTWTCLRTDDATRYYSRTGDLDTINSMNIVCFQDLGAEPVESMYMGNRIFVMRNILEARGDMSGKITHITSNLPINGSQTIERYGDRIVSRLQEMCNYFELAGQDRRAYGY